MYRSGAGSFKGFNNFITSRLKLLIFVAYTNLDYMIKTVLLLLLTFSFIIVFASSNDTIAKTKNYKNTIRWNITPMAVIGPKSLVLGYERTVSDWQSFSINFGYLEMAPMENEDGSPIEIFDQNTKGGFDISGDYRFYFKKRNKFKAPDGLYWGPYASYIALWQDASVNLIDKGAVVNTVFYDGQFSMLSLGVQLGYQFVIKDRFTIDLILMGPSYSYYELDLSLRYEQSISSDDPFYQELFKLVSASNPALANFMKKGSIDASGRLKFSYYGFRYGIQFGYRF